MPESGSESEINWPELKLTGLASGGGQRIAIINGKMLSEGRTIDGVRIVQISRDEIIVEYQGEQKTLHAEN